MTLPSLAGIHDCYRFHENEARAAMWARAFLNAGVADPAAWETSGRSPTEFLVQALAQWVDVGATARRAVFDVGITTDLGLGEPADLPDTVAWLYASPVGYTELVIGPAVREMERAHPQLPAFWYRCLVHSLCGFLRVWDLDDATETQSFDSEYDIDDEDEDGERIGLSPGLRKEIPEALRRTPLGKDRAVELLPELPPMSMELLRLAVELRDIANSNSWKWPEYPHECDHDFDEPPLPAAVISIDENDEIAGLFDRVSQGLGDTGNASPNILIRLDATKPRTLRHGNRIMTALAEVVLRLSRIATILDKARGVLEPDLPLAQVLVGAGFDGPWEDDE